MRNLRTRHTGQRSRIVTTALLVLCVPAAPGLARADTKDGAGNPTTAPAASAAPAVELTTATAGTANAVAPTPGAPSAGMTAAAASSAATDPVEKTLADSKASSDEAAAVAAALASGGGSDSGGSEFRLNFYGFGDFGFNKLFVNTPSNAFSPYETFAIGNLNLYMGAELGDNWRSLTEVRFMYLPSGQIPYSQQFAGGTRTDTTVGDYTDNERPIQWGGISLQRAWVERSFHKLLTVRAGQFLTPYGIWNVDHGSPVIIGVRRPYIVGENLFPQSQTGLEAYGTYDIDATQIGYHLTVSNGRGPISTYEDLDHNKAIGGRLYMHNDSLVGALTLGVSGYYGTYTDRHYASVGFTSQNVVDVQYKELSLAADVRWEYQGALLQSEVIVSDLAYTDAGRPAARVPGALSPDYRRYGVYGLAGYRFSFLGIMPFFGGEYYSRGDSIPGIPDVATIWGGLNVRPIPRIVLKAQGSHVWFPTQTALNAGMGNMQSLEFQIAWSF